MSLRHPGEVGIDASQDMLAIAQEVVSGYDPMPRLRACRFPPLPFEGATFDGVYAAQVLHHLEDSGAVSGRLGYPRTLEYVREVASVLKPGGLIALNTCTRDQLKAYWHLTQ
ncbi:MAG: class I SAM-dependent methyltransferase [Pseudomonadota bacterium]